MPKSPAPTTPLPQTPPLRPLERRLRALEGLLAKLVPVPPAWLSGSARASAGNTVSSGGGLGCIPCSSYEELTAAWHKALKWTDGLDHALAVMLASVTSTKSLGDQLWIKVIGPAACGKSTLCEALTVNTDYVFAKSAIRGFHSGYRGDKSGGGDEDNSLIPLIRDKTLVTKDGDTLLQSPNLGQILSEARDLYDGTSRTHYRNAMGKDYAGVRMTWLLCGTSSLRQIDDSELGERFLDCVIMERIDSELEDAILWEVVNRAQRNVSLEADGQPETHYAPELAEAMRLTGGYVGYLRENATDLLSQITASKTVLLRCAKLGKFVAFMRARPSKVQEESNERELAPRLGEQHIRLANCLAVVLNRSELDEEVMRRVTRVSLDTSRGRTLGIAACLYRATEGLGIRAINLSIGWTEEKTRGLLRFLRQIEAVESFDAKAQGMTGGLRWRLTPQVRRLYKEVIDTSR